MHEAGLRFFVRERCLEDRNPMSPTEDSLRIEGRSRMDGNLFLFPMLLCMGNIFVYRG